jgi:hypothetical protein
MIGTSASPSWPSAVSPRHANDAARLGVDSDLGAIDQVWALTGLAAQLGVRIGQRRRCRIGAAALGCRPRPRLGQQQLRTLERVRGNVASAPVAGRPRFRGSARRSRRNVAVLDGRKAGAQAGQRSVGLDIKPIDRQVRAIDHAVLATQRHQPQKQPLEQLGVDESPRLGVTDRLIHRQSLHQPVAKETADIDPHPSHPQQLTHRVDPLKHTDQHQLDQHDRIDRRAPNSQRIAGRRLGAHKPPIDQRIQPPQPITDRHQLVHTDHLDLKRRRLPLRRTHSHPRKGHKPSGQTRPFWTGP